MSSAPQAYAPIPQLYAGVRYRSRNEARWAWVFTQRSIPFLYEVEGFKLKAGWYVPDFLLSVPDMYFEVKPDRPKDLELEKLYQLADMTGKSCIVACGIPSFDVELFAIMPGGQQCGIVFTDQYAEGLGYLRRHPYEGDVPDKLVPVKRFADHNPYYSGQIPSEDHVFRNAGRVQFERDGTARLPQVPRAGPLARRIVPEALRRVIR